MNPMDPLGNTRTITDASGNVCYDADFTPYGQEIVHTNTCPQNYKFTGYERDPETGNDYAFARYYNPRLGRFLSADPSYTGKDQDTTAGLYDFIFRKYDPAQSRWTSPDPSGLSAVDISNPQSWNRYAYVANNPMDFIDPLGLTTVCLGQVSITTVDYFVDGEYQGTDEYIDPNGCAVGGGGGGQINAGGGGGGGGSLSGILNRTKVVNRCAGQLSQAGSVTNLAKNLLGLNVPEVLGSNFFGDVASLATGSGGLDQGMGVSADLTAHAAPAIASQVAVGTATSIGTAISHTAGVYNPVTVGTTTVTLGMKTAGKTVLGAAEDLLTGKLFLDAGVYVGALVVCSE